MKTALCDIRISEKCVKALRGLGYTVICLPPWDRLSSPVASHPDMLLFPIEDRVIVSSDYYSFAKNQIDELIKRTNKRLVLANDAASKDYPFDILFNALILGNRIYGKLSHLSRSVLRTAEELGYALSDTKQGYVKCSSLQVGERAVITADHGLADLFRKNGEDVLEISVGSILLPPYDYGFIGGASGVTEGEVLFCGDLRTHPDCERITLFCEKHGKRVLSLSDEPLLDVGSIFLFDE